MSQRTLYTLPDSYLHMRVWSRAIVHEQDIPKRYTCDGEDISPDLSWEAVEGGKYYAVIMDDPDAPVGTFTHWTIINLRDNSLPEGIEKRPETHFGIQGLNDFGRVGYNGPCPPRGHGKHRYYIRVYALKDRIDVKPKFKVGDLEVKLRTNVVDSGEIMGRYGR